MANLDNKFKTLPANVKAYLVSLKAAELNLFVLNKNKIAPTDFGKVTAIITHLFSKTIKVSDLPATLKSELNLDELAAKSLACDLVGVRLLIIKDWLEEDLETYIKNWGGNPSEYLHFIDEQKKALAEEEKYFATELKSEPEFVFKSKITSEPVATPVLDIAKEKTDSIALFKNNLVDLLKSTGGEEFIADYNLVLISLLSDDQDFKSNLEGALYVNSEELTAGRLKDEEKDISPTIANWLKDFIKQNGSDIFDDIILLDYLSKSPNAKNLNLTEKSLVKKLLKLYRNLSFFPDSMNNAPVEEWEIIPIDGTTESAIPTPVPVAKGTPAVSPIAALEETLNNYSPASLEYKVINQEIKRLKKRGTEKVVSRKPNV
ncbi:MAG: hypothetical protein WC458_01065 [Patescibacteria group bacterium]